MSITKRTIGRLPVSRGDWDASANYYKYNIVTNGGSTFMSVHDDAFVGSAYEPSVEYVLGEYIIKIGGVAQTPSTTYWQLMSYGGDAAQIAQDIASKADGDVDSAEGGIVPAYRALEADDLAGASTDRAEDQWSGYVRTTAGDLSIKSDANSARLLSVKGVLDTSNVAANSNAMPFNGSAFRWNLFNLLYTDQNIANSYVNNGVIASGGGKAMYWFNVPHLELAGTTLADLTTAAANNGCIFTFKSSAPGSQPADAGTSLINVYYSTTKPAIGTTVTSLNPDIAADGYRHYVTSGEGYLILEIENTSYTIANFCAHIAWSGYDNLRFEAPVAISANTNVIDFTTPRNNIHAWGMAGIYDQATGQGAYDEVVFDEDNTANRKWYRRIDRALLNNWGTIGTIVEGEITYYTSSMTFSGMLADGLYDKSVLDRIHSVDNDYVATMDPATKTLTVKFTVEKTAADLNTAFGSLYLYYQITEVSGTHSISGIGTPNDMSTEEYVEPSEGLSGSVTTKTSYIQGLRDYIRLLPTLINNINLVVAEHIMSLRSDIEGIKDTIMHNLGNINVQSIDSVNKPRYNGYDSWIEDTKAPDRAPDFIKQIWINTSTKIAWIACGISAASDWKQITNA